MLPEPLAAGDYELYEVAAPYGYVLSDQPVPFTIALLLQALRYACGESHLQSIDVDSIKGALQLNEYCENCYQRCRAFVAEDTCDSMSKELLYLLEDSFDTKTAIKTGMENLRVTDRTVMNYIKELMKSGLITKAKKGFYEKVKFETGQATET